ncbi:MAG: DUF262 domain-containing protein [Gallionellaceae bacterium]|nr:DUF262 domain-containing protein [Gallionellaceae bacterium]
MDARPISVCKLFEDEGCYLIPIFQRGYVWERKSQWQPLWADICAQVERDQNAQRHAPRNPRCQHFLGAVVINAHEARTGQANRFEVIDGQQRITTLYLLLAALRDVADHKKVVIRDTRDDDIVGMLTTRRRNVDAKYDRKLVPTAAFLPQLNEIMAANNPLLALRQRYPLLRSNSQDPYKAGSMAACYLYFASKFEKFFDGIIVDADEETEIEGLTGMTPGQRFYILKDSIFAGLHLVALHLGLNDDPQSIFESLNARGIPLTPADLIRNHVFLSGLNAEEEPNQEDLYNTYWRQFDAATNEASPWRRPEKLGRIQMTLLDLYCFHFVVAVRGESIPLKHLYPQFRDWWNDSSQERGFETTIRDFTDTAERYLALFNAAQDNDDPVMRLAVLLRDLDLTVAMPVALALERQREKLGNDLASICTNISSYVVRRLFTGVQSQGFNNIIPLIIESVNKGGLDALRERMLKWQGRTMAWIKNDDFERDWLSDPTYKTLGPKRTNVILRLLDQAMRNERNERMLFKQNLSVEHILPQKWTPDNYPFMSGNDSLQQDVYRNQYLHNIGNLTLLTQSLNSSVSNGPFVWKRSLIAQQSSLRLNAYFQSPPDGLNIWDENSIKRRAEGLLEIGLRLWPRPE